MILGLNRTLAAIFAMLVLPAVTQADISRPARVIDGDSLVVAGERVRLFGIDAPERGQKCRPGGEDWNCGKEAESVLKGKIGNRELDCRERSRDRYGRVSANGPRTFPRVSHETRCDVLRPFTLG